MDIELSLRKSCNELEEALNPSYFDCIEVYEPSGNIESGGVIYIVTQDEPHYITSATWAYGDNELERILQEGNQTKCIIIADSVKINNLDVHVQDGLIGIKGICVDDGGENYLVYPLITFEGSGDEKLEICHCGEIQEYLS